MTLPQHVPSPRELDDLDLIRVGALGHAVGAEEDEVTLVVPVDLHGAERIELIDPEGVPRGTVVVDRTYEFDDESVGIVGSFAPSAEPRGRFFAELRISPDELRQQCATDAVLCMVDAPPTTDDLETIEALSSGREVVLLALAGEGSPRHVSPAGLVRAVVAAASRMPTARVVVAPVARRPDPSRDALFRTTVARAFAPGEDVIWPSGLGERDAEIERIVRSDRPTGAEQGLVVFFTGLSGSGKSTIASALQDRIVESGLRTVSLLDGDRVRRHLSRGLSFSRVDREINIERIGWVAAEISRHGGMAICSPIAPFDQTRKAARAMTVEAGGAFVLVHVATPLSECERRDRKGLYAQARRGDIPDFTGISSPYEVPQDAELVIDTSERTIDDELDEVIEYLASRGLLQSSDEPQSITQAGGSES